MVDGRSVYEARKRIGMELVHPVQGVGHQEALDLVAPEVEDVGAPILLLTLSRIGMLEQRGAVEPAQRPVVLGEVPGNPVEDDADALGMQGLHQVPEIIWRTEPGIRCEIAGDLVAPAALERM